MKHPFKLPCIVAIGSLCAFSLTPSVARSAEAHAGGRPGQPAAEEASKAEPAAPTTTTTPGAEGEPSPAVSDTQPAPGSPELEFRTGERDKWQLSLRGGAQYDFATDIDDTDADVSVFRAQFGLGLSYELSQQWLLNLDTDAELSFYEFNGFGGVIGPSDDPVDDVAELTFRLSATYIHSAQWAFFGGGIVQFAGEFDADVGDTATYGGFGGVRWQASKQLALSFGLLGKSRLEDDALIVPLISVDWRIDDTWALASTGLEATLSAALAKQWSWLLVGGWRPREYRLDDDNDLPGGVFQDDRVYVGTGVEFRPNPISSIRLLGGVTLWSELTFEDDSGVEVFEETTDPTGFLGVRGTLRF